MKHGLVLVGVIAIEIVLAIVLVPATDHARIISASYSLAVQKRQFAAGLVLALATGKFQIVLILVLLLLVSRKYRLVGGFVAGCVVLTFASVLVTGSSGIVEYFRLVHRFDLHNGYGNINPASMMNFRGLLAGLGWEDHRRLFSINRFRHAHCVGHRLFAVDSRY